MTRRLAFLAIAALAASCGGDEASHEEAPPEVPVFAGLDSAALVPGEIDMVELTWTRGTDDKTPPERLRYELTVRANRDDSPAIASVYDVSDRLDGTYRWANLPMTGNVYWFSVTVYDEDGNQAGADVLRPAVSPSQPPRITSVSPARIEAGKSVELVGEFLLDEPMLPDALTIGGQVVPREAITWTSREITFVVPRNLVGEGRIAVATPFGRVEAPEPLLIDPPGPVGHD